MSEHAIRWFFDQDTICCEAICTAPPGANCRLSCPEGCEQWSTERADGQVFHVAGEEGDGTEIRHALEPVPYCNVCEFLNSDGDIPELAYKVGTFDLAVTPILPIWEGDYYSWELASGAGS